MEGTWEAVVLYELPRLLSKGPSGLWEVGRSERGENSRDRRLCAWFVGPKLESEAFRSRTPFPAVES